MRDWCRTSAELWRRSRATTAPRATWVAHGERTISLAELARRATSKPFVDHVPDRQSPCGAEWTPPRVTVGGESKSRSTRLKDYGERRSPASPEPKAAETGVIAFDTNISGFRRLRRVGPSRPRRGGRVHSGADRPRRCRPARSSGRIPGRALRAQRADQRPRCTCGGVLTPCASRRASSVWHRYSRSGTIQKRWRLLLVRWCGLATARRCYRMPCRGASGETRCSRRRRLHRTVTRRSALLTWSPSGCADVRRTVDDAAQGACAAPAASRRRVLRTRDAEA